MFHNNSGNLEEIPKEAVILKTARELDIKRIISSYITNKYNFIFGSYKDDNNIIFLIEDDNQEKLMENY